MLLGQLLGALEHLEALEHHPLLLEAADDLANLYEQTVRGGERRGGGAGIGGVSEWKMFVCDCQKEIQKSTSAVKRIIN
jgi:hypothetical protein